MRGLKNKIIRVSALIMVFAIMMLCCACSQKTDTIDYSRRENWAYYAVGEDKEADLFLICPTVDMGNNIKAETHVFGNVGNLYGKKISVEFIKLIRPEKQFPDVNTLKTQVESDKIKAKEIHGI